MPQGIYKRKPVTPETRAILSKASRNSDAVKAHNDAMRGVPKTSEHCAAISAAQTDVPLSPEHCAAISKAHTGVPLSSEHIAARKKAHMGVPHSPEHIAAMQESDDVKAHTETMRGGNDICNHHYIYDHSDLSKNTIEMTRSDHTRLHNNMRKSGIKVPHINENKIGE